MPLQPEESLSEVTSGMCIRQAKRLQAENPLYEKQNVLPSSTAQTAR
jgi:hypothetical protein